MPTFGRRRDARLEARGPNRYRRRVRSSTAIVLVLAGCYRSHQRAEPEPDASVPEPQPAGPLAAFLASAWCEAAATCPSGLGRGFIARDPLASISDIRPESSFPYHLRLEAGLAGASDAGAGTLAFLARWYLIGIDVGPLVDLRLGGHIGGTHYEAGYSRRCSPCEKAFEANAGLDFETMFTIRPIRLFDWDWRLEVGVHLALTWIFDRSSTAIMAGRVGLRCAFLLG